MIQLSMKMGTTAMKLLQVYGMTRDTIYALSKQNMYLPVIEASDYKIQQDSQLHFGDGV